MQNLLISLLSAAYACVGILATIGYLPTVRDLWLRKRMSANLTSYIIWTVCSGTAFLYSLFILKDLLFRIVSGLNFACCATILLLCLALSRREKRRRKKK